MSRRFPSGTATANVIRTLFGVPRELPRQVVAEVEQAAGGPAARQLLPTLQPAAQHAAPGTPRTPTTPHLERGRSGGVDRGHMPSPTGGKLSGRRFSTDDIPFLDLRSAASLARADTASMLPTSHMPSGANPDLMHDARATLRRSTQAKNVTRQSPVTGL